MRILASVIQKIGVGVMSPKTFVSQVVVALSAVAAFTVSAGFGSSVSAVPQGVQSVTGLGTTYVDTTTDGGDWYLVGYGASGNVGRIDSQNGTFNASARTGSATLDASTFVQGATEIAFAWTAAGGSLPTGGLASYDKAVSFVLPNASTMTLTGAASPSSGSSASNFSTIGTSADQSTLRVKNIVGTSGMPRYMFIRNKTLGVRSGSSYGLVSNPLINNQLDWTPDTQNFSAIYAGHNGTNGYVTTGGTSNGYVPATMSIWVRKPSECTETSTANGSRRVVKFTRIGTCTWTAPWGVSSVDVLVVAGGGGAGDGGGGAGGVITQSNVSVSNSVSVTVGEGGAGSRMEILQFVLHLDTQFSVKRTERFIEEQDPGTKCERASQSNPLLLTTRQLSRIATSQTMKLNQVEHLLDPLGDHRARLVAHFERVSDILFDCHMREECITLKYDPEIAFFRREVRDV